jgi:RNA polymerase sigma-70 factor, ECF subfamily
VGDLAPTQYIVGESHVDVAIAEERGWVERSRRGDAEAFELIVMRYESKILRFLTGLVGSIEAAQDLCQDTFLAAYQALSRSEAEMRLSAWLHTIALNKARSHHRRRRFKVFVPIEDHDIAAEGADLQDSVANTEAVQQALSRMPRQYAEVLLLQITGGLSCREIGRVVGCSEGAVKVRLLRAREAFRRVYDEEVPQPCTT